MLKARAPSKQQRRTWQIEHSALGQVSERERGEGSLRSYLPGEGLVSNSQSPPKVSESGGCDDRWLTDCTKDFPWTHFWEDTLKAEGKMGWGSCWQMLPLFSLCTCINNAPCPLSSLPISPVQARSADRAGSRRGRRGLEKKRYPSVSIERKIIFCVSAVKRKLFSPLVKSTSWCLNSNAMNDEKKPLLCCWVKPQAALGGMLVMVSI